MSDTPRTDAVMRGEGTTTELEVRLLGVACEVERELAEAKKERVPPIAHYLGALQTAVKAGQFHISQPNTSTSSTLYNLAAKLARIEAK